MTAKYGSAYPNLPRHIRQQISVAVWIVSIIAGAAAFFEMQMFSALINEGPFTLLSVSIIGAIIGAVIGTGVMLIQRLAPLHQVQKTDAWIFGTIGGWALAGTLFELLYRITIPLVDTLMSEVPSYFIMGAGVGFGFGVGQWLAAGHYLAKSQLLLVSNLIGWSLGLAIGRFVYQFNFGTAQGYILAIISVGITAGLITGLTLNKLVSTQQ